MDVVEAVAAAAEEVALQAEVEAVLLLQEDLADLLAP